MRYTSARVVAALAGARATETPSCLGCCLLSHSAPAFFPAPSRSFSSSLSVPSSSASALVSLFPSRPHRADTVVGHVHDIGGSTKNCLVARVVEIAGAIAMCAIIDLKL